MVMNLMIQKNILNCQLNFYKTLYDDTNLVDDTPLQNILGEIRLSYLTLIPVNWKEKLHMPNYPQPYEI